MKKILVLLLILIFLLTIFFIANKNTTRKIGINFKIFEYQIPIYLKILDFYDRHYNYKYLVKKINKNLVDEKDIILNTAKWIKNNIQKVPEGVDVVDSHPITIVERRLGVSDQFSDLLSVLLVYANIDSFFITFNFNWHSLTFFKVDNHWSIIDPYYGVYFTNNERLFASIKDLKNKKWQISNLESDKIDKLKFKEIFGNKFNDYDEVTTYYNKVFKYLPSSEDIDNTHVFYRGGRSYNQSPLGRLRFKIYNIINTKRQD